VASALQIDFRDTDQIFTTRHGSISEFFQLSGEDEFRKIERQIVDESIREPGVVSTGGGVVLSEENRQALKATTVIYLKTDGTHMAKRLSQGKRPLIENGLADWKRIYDERKPLYESVADVTIDCSGVAIKATVEEILTALNK
jgi:shikimate kinase